MNISLEANDPDDISSMRLFYSVMEDLSRVSAWEDGTKYEATVPAQSRKSVVSSTFKVKIAKVMHHTFQKMDLTQEPFIRLMMV